MRHKRTVSTHSTWDLTAPGAADRCRVGREVAEASAEQSRGVHQVNKTVTEMDKVVQQNASAVQQSAAAAQAMRNHAETMVRAVSAFRLSDEAAASAMPAAAAVIAAAKASTTLPVVSREKQLAVAAPADDWEQF